MIRHTLTFALLTSPVARADVFERYFADGVRSRVNYRPEPACAQSLSPTRNFLRRFAADLMLSPEATRDFLTRLRPALDDVDATGVILAGPRLHRMFAGDMAVDLRVIVPDGQPTTLHPAFKFHYPAGRDLLDGTDFDHRFGASTFYARYGTYVRGQALDVRPRLDYAYHSVPEREVPYVAQVDALRERLAHDLSELERVAHEGGELDPGNAFRIVKDDACAPTTYDFAGVHKVCLGPVFRHVFNSVANAVGFAAGADTIILLRAGAPEASAWYERLVERGYTKIFSLSAKGEVRRLTKAPPAIAKVRP